MVKENIRNLKTTAKLAGIQKYYTEVEHVQFKLS